MKYFTLLFCAAMLLPLHAVSQVDSKQITTYLTTHRADLKLTKDDVKNWRISDQHFDASSDLNYVYVNQTYNGVDIYNAIANFAIKEDMVLLTGNHFIPDVANSITNSTSTLSAEEAILRVFDILGIAQQESLVLLEEKDNRMMYDKGSYALENILVKQVYVPTDNSVVLAWDISIAMLDKQHWWSMRIDAATGEEIDRHDWVVSCRYGESAEAHAQHTRKRPVKELTVAGPLPMMPPPATDEYRVFALPTESPNHGGRSLVVGPSDATASPYGWHDDNGIAGNEYTDTRGNNVRATEDMNDNNGFGYSPSGGASLSFDFALNMNQAPSNYLDPAITNLFYMNNMMHDVWYHYGFDEVSGNFQENNYGSGGVASDGVYADAQDGGGMNNANFATPVDGQNPRMQMYLWNNNSPDYFTVNSPSGIAGVYNAVPAGFGPPIPTSPITTDLVIYDDNVPDANDACEVAVNAAAISGKIVLVKRGTCTFVNKVTNAQNAGAAAVIVINNTGGAPIAMGGTGGSITIPSVMISQADGNLLISEILSGATVNATLVDSGVFDLDGDLDNGIIAHEYGHGISNRLTGGASNSNCLSNAEQMGEGWSDWFCLMMTIEPGDTETDNRGIGTFVTGEPTTGIGIRPAPYNTDFAVNNYTYAATNNTGAISQPHGIGFVWATMLWDMTWALIDKYGFDPDIHNGTGGNNIAMHLVIQGLKLQPCSPGFEDGRDAILAADQLLYSGANQCLLWNVFANRGLGYSADQGSTNSRTDQVEAFDIPPGFVNTSGSASVTSCNSYTWSATGTTYTSSGSYTAILPNATGCDSTATLNLTIAPATSSSSTVTACSNYTWPANSTTYTASGIYTELLTNAVGCDSTVTLNLTINPTFNETQVVSACSNYTWPANGTTYSTSGMYTAMLTSVTGCDSIVTLDLTMSTVASTSQSVTSCGSYTWSTTGATYTSTGSYADTLTSSTGCDSIVTLNLTINAPTAGSQNVSICDSYTWAANGTTYTTSGSYTSMLTNAVGCDSTATLNLTILPPTPVTNEVVTDCDAYTWPVNGTNYTASGTYTASFLNANGCDSSYVLDLTLGTSYNGGDSVVTCDAYTWPVNGMNYTTSGIYSETFTNATGCDSVLTLDLTLNSANATISFVDIITLTADQSGASYQWVDCDNNNAVIAGATNQVYAPTSNGSYAVIVTENDCSDTSACMNVSSIGLIENSIGDIVKIYPNPTGGSLMIDLGIPQTEVKLQLYNVLGQIIAEERFTNVAKFAWHIDAAPGTYSLRITGDDSYHALSTVVKY